jgi:hypothetical protein
LRGGDNREVFREEILSAAVVRASTAAEQATAAVLHLAVTVLWAEEERGGSPRKWEVEGFGGGGGGGVGVWKGRFY